MLLPLVAALMAPTPQAALSAKDSADGRCIAVFGYLGAHGSPEQATSVRQGIMFFAGKLRERDAGADIAAIVTRAAAEAQAADLSASAEGQRCQAEVQSAAQSLHALRAASAPAPSPAPTPAPPSAPSRHRP